MPDGSGLQIGLMDTLDLEPDFVPLTPDFYFAFGFVPRMGNILGDLDTQIAAGRPSIKNTGSSGWSTGVKRYSVLPRP